MTQKVDNIVSNRAVARHPCRLKFVATAALAALHFGCAPPAPSRRPAVMQPTPIFRFEGDVQLHNGVALAYSAILIPDPALPGSYLGTMDIPKQAMRGAALQSVAFDPGERVEFALNGEGQPRWIGAYDSDGTLACEFRQAGVRLPCSMRELKKDVLAVAPVAPHRQQTPLPPFPYTSEQVRYVNPSAHVLLAGTLTLPAGAGPHPALMVVGDLGMWDRDGSLAGHKPWLVLADHLARAGISVLRVDPRARADGARLSAGDGEFAALQSDVESGLAFLRGRADVDSKRLGLIGHGYGAVIAASVSNQAGVEFIVLLASPALSGRQVLSRKGELDALAAGASPEAADRVREELQTALANIESEPVPARRRGRLAALSERLAARRDGTTGDLTLDQMLSLAETPGIRDFAARDPMPLLRAVSIPVLALVPELDREIDPTENLAALRVAFADHSNARIETLPRINHRLQTADAGTPAEYEMLSETFAPAALDRITSWTLQVSSISD